MSKIKRFDELVVGDIIPDENGNPVVVTRAYDTHIPETMYEIEVESGKKMKVSGNHLFYVETSLDRSLHSRRKRQGRKMFKNLPDHKKSILIEISGRREEVHTSLKDMLTLMDAKDDKNRIAAVVRVAESLGHIKEDNLSYQDMLTDEIIDTTVIRSYDAVLFAQQLLSLMDRKYAKKWPLIVGRVANVEQISMWEIDVYIPDNM